MTSPFHWMNRSFPDNSLSETCQPEGTGQFPKISSPITRSFNQGPPCPEKIILLSHGFRCFLLCHLPERCLERQKHCHNYNPICNTKMSTDTCQRRVFCLPWQGSVLKRQQQSSHIIAFASPCWDPIANLISSLCLFFTNSIGTKHKQQ